MHTNTVSRRRHRWLVALPLIAVIILLTVGDAAHRASLLSMVTTVPEVINVPVSGEPQTMVLSDEVVKAEPGAIMNPQDELLQQGTVLVASKALSHLRVADLTLTGWNGSFQASLNDDVLTVAALGTPVLVEQHGQKMIVPAFTQWRNGQSLTSFTDGMDTWLLERSVQSLPDSFIADALVQTKELLSLEHPMDQAATVSPLGTFGQFLRLSASRSRMESQARTARITALTDALTAPSSDLPSLLGANDLPELLSSPEGQAALPQLLSLALDTGKMPLFLPYFTESTDLFLLASFHPLLRDYTWVLPTPRLSEDENALRLFLLPSADALPDAMAPVAVEQWQMALHDFLTNQKEEKALAAAILPKFSQQVADFSALNYPERAQRYSDIVDALAKEFGVEVAAITPHPVPLPEGEGDPLHDSSQSSSSSVSSVSSSASVDIANTQALLQHSGFMFLPTTSLKPVGNLVEVTDVVLGAKAGDLSMNFTFDPAHNQVSGIVQDGKEMPFSMSLQQFVEWERMK